MEETLCVKIESYDKKNNQHEGPKFKYDLRVPAPQGVRCRNDVANAPFVESLEKVEQHSLSLFTCLACGWEDYNSCL
jgi:hypothetical protein